MGQNRFQVNYEALHDQPARTERDEQARSESMVVDERSGFSPAEQVQQKLIRLAHGQQMLVSSLHTSRLINRQPRN